MDIPGLQPAVLLCRFCTDARAERIRGYLRGRGIRVIEVPAEKTGLALGRLLEIPGFPAGPGTAVTSGVAEEMLVMHAFRGTMMQDFLQFFRDERLEPVALKAVATPTNLFWSPAQLCTELQRERDWFERQKQAAGSAGKEDGHVPER
ncbi:MAG: DUF3783 domain-containing protein [Oscillospiraceae bacterium]|nr:DUF3783 domain-containing protein [Oscillospiraceae bacterium]